MTKAAVPWWCPGMVEAGQCWATLCDPVVVADQIASQPATSASQTGQFHLSQFNTIVPTLEQKFWAISKNTTFDIGLDSLGYVGFHAITNYTDI